MNLTAHPELSATLKGFVLDVAAYRLFSRRPPVSDAIVNVRKGAIEWLSKVSRGDVVLPAATVSDEPSHGWGSSEPNLSTLRDEL